MYEVNIPLTTPANVNELVEIKWDDSVFWYSRNLRRLVQDGEIVQPLPPSPNNDKAENVKKSSLVDYPCSSDDEEGSPADKAHSQVCTDEAAKGDEAQSQVRTNEAAKGDEAQSQVRTDEAAKGDEAQAQARTDEEPSSVDNADQDGECQDDADWGYSKQASQAHPWLGLRKAYGRAEAAPAAPAAVSRGGDDGLLEGLLGSMSQEEQAYFLQIIQ